MTKTTPLRGKLLFATKNKGKVKELRALLEAIPLEILSATDLPDFPSVRETGSTFEENALLKARESAIHAGMPALADDSGLVVDALDGAPGVLSARYSGPGATDARNTELVLHRLRKTPWTRRTARFRCVVAFVDPKNIDRNRTAPTDSDAPNPDEITQLAHGSCEGYILEAPKGASGFGYDPVFYYPELAKTFAELAASAKNKISHRAHAMKTMASFLADYFEAL